jgi:protein TonB
MNFSQRQADPRRHLVGLTIVILVHAFIVYALVTGLAKKVVDVVRAPIETKVIEEIKKPPPPPEVMLPPPPKLEAPPPPYIPPPEVQIATPPPPQPTISVAPSPTPPPPTVMTPTPPVVAAVPAPAPRPAAVNIGVVCPNQPKPVLPRKALAEGISGEVMARATIKGGKVVSVDIISSKPRGVFDAAVRTAMMQYSCQTSGDEVLYADQPFEFKVGE